MLALIIVSSIVAYFAIGAGVVRVFNRAEFIMRFAGEKGQCDDTPLLGALALAWPITLFFAFVAGAVFGLGKLAGGRW